jgi:hypothetical protein
VQSIERQRMFRSNISSPSSRWFLFLAYYSSLKMEATYSSEKPVDFQHSTRRYIPDDRNLQIKGVCENGTETTV